MNIGQKVIIRNTNSVWDGKEGIVEDINEDMATVFVNFIPEQQKRVRQDFYLDNLESSDYNDNSEVNSMNEELEKKVTEDIEDDDTQRIISALAKYFNVDEDSIEMSSWGDGHVFTVDDAEYWVGTYDEAYAEAVESARSILDDIGLEALSDGFRDYAVSHYVNTDEIEDWMRESYGYYIEDIESEGSNDFDNRLIEEMYDEGILTDDDFEMLDDDIDYTTLKDEVDLDEKKEEFLDSMCNREDPLDWLSGMYTSSEMSKVLEENGLIDFDSIAEECVDEDGIAHYLASYDGEEHDLGDGLYAYRGN